MTWNAILTDYDSAKGTGQGGIPPLRVTVNGKEITDLNRHCIGISVVPADVIIHY